MAAVGPLGSSSGPCSTPPKLLPLGLEVYPVGEQRNAIVKILFMLDWLYKLRSFYLYSRIAISILVTRHELLRSKDSSTIVSRGSKLLERLKKGGQTQTRLPFIHWLALLNKNISTPWVTAIPTQYFNPCRRLLRRVLLKKTHLGFLPAWKLLDGPLPQRTSAQQPREPVWPSQQILPTRLHSLYARRRRDFQTAVEGRPSRAR